MIVFASFNGGPTEQAVHFAILSSGIIGVIVGGIARRPGIGFLAGVVSGVLLGSVLLIRGNQPGDAAGLFLVGALIIFGPLCGLLSGVLAAMSGWIAGKLLKLGHEATQEGTTSTTDAGFLSTGVEPDTSADRPHE